MAKKTPLQVVEADHGGKEKLVDKLVGLLDRGDESKDEFRSRLSAMANSKLLRLHSAAATIKDQFGNKEKLVDALLELTKRVKDLDYKDRLLDHTPVRLLSLYHAAEKRAAKARRKAKVA